MINKYNIIIFGPQGSGKGTQAEILSHILNIPHISPGEMFRQIKKENTDFAKKIAKFIDKGKLVPDEYTNKMIIERIKKEDCRKGFILDGYPRNKSQAEYLNNKIKIDYVIVIQIPDKIGIERISGRRICANGHTYHIKYAPPKNPGICDKDNLPLKQRGDETKKAIKQRLNIYHKDTEPLIDEYKRMGVKIIEIDGKPPIPEVAKEIKEKLNIIKK